VYFQLEKMSLLLILLILLGVMIVVVYYFHKQNRAEQELHMQNLAHFQKSITQHQNQIVKRSQGLMTYDFLKYNLSEALLVQPEIVLY
jgi:lipopolysaccharide export system protein LptC